MNNRKNSPARRLTSASVQFAAMLLALYLLAAVAAINVPAALLVILAENALLGIYYRLEAPRHADPEKNQDCI